MPPERPLLTIAIPTYNRSEYLAQLLTALAPQLAREPRVELLISDNASPIIPRTSSIPFARKGYPAVISEMKRTLAQMPIFFSVSKKPQVSMFGSSATTISSLQGVLARSPLCSRTRTTRSFTYVPFLFEATTQADGKGIDLVGLPNSPKWTVLRSNCWPDVTFIARSLLTRQHLWGCKEVTLKVSSVLTWFNSGGAFRFSPAVARVLLCGIKFCRPAWATPADMESAVFSVIIWIA